MYAGCNLYLSKISISIYELICKWYIKSFTVYECIQKACDNSLYPENKDWGYYTQTNGNCELCKNLCIEDDTCESVECGSSYCRWWKNGLCNEAHELTVSTDDHVVTCLKDSIGTKFWAIPLNFISTISLYWHILI